MIEKKELVISKKLYNLGSDIEKGIISINSASSSSSTLNTSYSSTDSTPLIDEISDVQPSVHEDKKSCCEMLCKNILFGNYDLTKSEYKKFNNLRKECLIIYDQNNENHEKLLRDLFENYLELIGCSKNEKSNTSWKDLGFQSENPRTDFRAGGLYALTFMHYFVWKHSDEFMEMIRLDYFLFAVVAIRLTYLFKLFINLVKDEELESGLKSHKIHSCKRKDFKRFCHFLNYNESILLVLLSRSLIFVKNIFKLQFDETKKELNFLLIEPLLKRSLTCLEKNLNAKISTDDIVCHIESIFSNEESVEKSLPN